MSCKDEDDIYELFVEDYSLSPSDDILIEKMKDIMIKLTLNLIKKKECDISYIKKKHYMKILNQK